MNKRDAIIADAEEDFGLELDSNFDPGVNGLCDGDTCRHSECDCWDNFQAAVEGQLQKQENDRLAELRSMKSLYDAEVHYGIHVPGEAL